MGTVGCTQAHCHVMTMVIPFYCNTTLKNTAPTIDKTQQCQNKETSFT